MKMKKKVAMFLMVVLLLSFSLIIVTANSGETDEPQDFSQCIREAKIAKNSCYKEAKSISKEEYEGCKDGVEPVDSELTGKERREAVKIRRDELRDCKETYNEDYKAAKEECNGDFEEAKLACENPQEEQEPEDKDDKQCKKDTVKGRRDCFTFSLEAYKTCKDAMIFIDPLLRGDDRKEVLVLRKEEFKACKDAFNAAKEVCEEEFELAKCLCE